MKWCRGALKQAHSRSRTHVCRLCAHPMRFRINIITIIIIITTTASAVTYWAGVDGGNVCWKTFRDFISTPGNQMSKPKHRASRSGADGKSHPSLFNCKTQALQHCAYPPPRNHAGSSKDTQEPMNFTVRNLCRIQATFHKQRNVRPREGIHNYEM